MTGQPAIEDLIDAKMLTQIMEYGRTGRRWSRIRTLGIDDGVARSTWSLHATDFDITERRRRLTTLDDDRTRIYVDMWAEGTVLFQNDPRASRKLNGRMPLPETFISTMTPIGRCYRTPTDEEVAAAGLKKNLQ